VDGYSRLVAFLKVLLPLAALGILSTLFLLSRSVDPTTTLPFGEAEMSERLAEERITAPYFSGTTDGGDQIIITAVSARPEGQGRLARADGMTAQIDLVGGARITLQAASGTFDPANDLARFAGNVEITTTTGYRLTTEALETGIKSLSARTDGPITGDSPLGQLQAGRMELTTDPETQDAQLLFKDGIKLVYDPSNRER
jgi:lipopolysaccharide export system protein LptC